MEQYPDGQKFSTFHDTLSLDPILSQFNPAHTHIFLRSSLKLSSHVSGFPNTILY
jgi:hypothetical protein